MVPLASKDLHSCSEHTRIEDMDTQSFVKKNSNKATIWVAELTSQPFCSMAVA